MQCNVHNKVQMSHVVHFFNRLCLSAHGGDNVSNNEIFVVSPSLQRG